MRDCHPASVGCQLRRCLHHGHVDRVRALGAAKDQNPRRPVGRACSGDRFAKNSGRTGLPATNPLLPKKRTVDSKVTAAALTNRASSRLVSPGTAFCSSSSVGMPRIAAASDDRARAVAADADHQLRRAARQDSPRVEPARRQQQQSARRAASDIPFKPGAAQQIELEILRAARRAPRSPAPCRQT